MHCVYTTKALTVTICSRVFPPTAKYEYFLCYKILLLSNFSRRTRFVLIRPPHRNILQPACVHLQHLLRHT